MAGEQEMTVDVNDQIARSFSREYVEAVVTDALKILPAYKDRRDSLVVLNARRVAVILDKQARRGSVIPGDLIEKVVSGPAKERLQAYLASPTQAYYVLHIAGSWFLPDGGISDKTEEV
jgi:hypothetical protein